jgi:polyhydroxyalkanoate synthesis repressor PhaR
MVCRPSQAKNVTMPDPQRVLIKKYSDRRLYDSAAKRYVNLEDIARMIRSGVDLEVREAGTGKDITRLILTQIIADDARDEQAGLPLKVLHQLVVMSDHASREYLAPYFEGAFELYQKAGAAVRSRVSGATSAVLSPVDFVRHLLGGDGAQSELEELRRRVRELEEQLAGRAPRKQARKSTRKA